MMFSRSGYKYFMGTLMKYLLRPSGNIMMILWDLYEDFMGTPMKCLQGSQNALLKFSCFKMSSERFKRFVPVGTFEKHFQWLREFTHVL